MAYTIVIGGKNELPLASSSGWSDTKDWIDTLEPVEDFNRLIQLAEHGWTHSPAELREHIAAALNGYPPDDDVAATMRDLIESLANAADDDSVFVSDGTSDESGEGEAWTEGEHDVEPLATPRDPQKKTVELANAKQPLAIQVIRPVNRDDDLIATAPDVPDFDSLADESLTAVDSILARIRRKLLGHHETLNSDYSAEMDELELLVAQSYLAGLIAGSVGIFHSPGRRVANRPTLTLELPPEWWDRKTTTRYPWITEASRWLQEKGVASAGSLNEAADAAEAATRVRWDSIQSVADLRTHMADSIVVGDSFAEFKARIGKAVNDVRPNLETGFRTATHQAYIQGATATLEKPSIARLFPAVEYMSTDDTRVRDTHRHLDGIVAEIGSETYNIFRRALADFNCRCSLASIQRKNLSKHPAPTAIGDLPADVLSEYAR